jgi:hypothetical protein
MTTTPNRPRGTRVNPQTPLSRGTKLSPAWKPEYYVRIYELAKTGLSDAEVAAALGVDRKTFWSWKTGDAAVADALLKGRSGTSGVQKFLDYVYQRLPDELQACWDEIQEVEDGSSTVSRLEAMLQSKGEYARKLLFVHALVHYNFNPSDACRAVNITKGTLEYWVGTDHRFGKLLDQIVWHKKNLFEGKLVELVMSGDTAATIFVNKTLNKDRGYGKEVKHIHSGAIEHNHTTGEGVSKRLLNQLTPSAKKELLEAMRREVAQNKLALAPHQDDTATDAEVV